MAQTAERQIQMVEVLSSMPTGVIFCCWILFSRSKASGTNIAIIANIEQFLMVIFNEH